MSKYVQLHLESNMSLFHKVFLPPHFIVHCLFSEWGEWSSCSVTCGNGPDAGTRERTRNIAREAANGGCKCSGSTREATGCVFCDEKKQSSDAVGSYQENSKKKNIKAVDGSKCIGPCPSKT